MISPEWLYLHLKEQGIEFFTGVPDSLLKNFLKYIQDHSESGNHVITANEGLAVALASGYHFRSGKLPVVYLQNSGLGNAINPLTSLADKEMYSVPMLLMIGWRGRPGTSDEPQHKKMGRITAPMLEVLEIPYFILDGNQNSTMKKIEDAIEEATFNQKPVALLVQEDVFEKYDGLKTADSHSLKREEVISKIIENLKGDEVVICTTGKIGREFNEQNILADKKISKYFLSVGAMGHANHIALGVKDEAGRKILMIDGDGAILMHMGSLPVIARQIQNNFIHVVLNNGSHESVGGQPTEGFFADLCGIAKASGYKKAFCISDENELEQWLKNDLGSSETQFVEIRINRSSRSDLGRPSGNTLDWKKEFQAACNLKSN